MGDANEQLAKDRTSYAEDRTDWAEDRTAMANERTFAGWMRTAFAAIGIGIGFNALFDELEPVWVPKAVATMFILLGIALIYLAQRRACHTFRTAIEPCDRETQDILRSHDELCSHVGCRHFNRCSMGAAR